jgi:elongator complex protein 3
MLSCLKGHALIRELHVYGQHTGVAAESQQPTQQIFQQTQHRGLGKALLAKAEEIATQAGYKHITVISGVGVKEYYRRRGYRNYETYLTKTLYQPNSLKNLFDPNNLNLSIVGLLWIVSWIPF